MSVLIFHIKICIIPCGGGLFYCASFSENSNEKNSCKFCTVFPKTRVMVRVFLSHAFRAHGAILENVDLVLLG